MALPIYDHLRDAPVAVIVPIRSFDGCKQRLAPVLSADERSRLVMAMAARVLDAARPMPTVVATADHDVVDWARARSVPALATGGESLDADATEAIDFLADHGVGAALIAHADLPRAQRLDHLVRSGTVVLVPDRAEDGTNVCLVPTDAGFRFAYGPGSFARHRAEAERLGLEVEIVVDDDLALDVDEPGHLAAASHLMPSVTAGI